MKRWLKRILPLFLLVLLGAAGGRLAWLTGTANGARSLLQTLSKRTGVHITARQVEGALFGHLRMKGVHFRAAQVEADIDSVDLQVNPGLIAIGAVEIQSAILQGVRIQDNSPRRRTASDLTWPKVSWMAAQPFVDLRQLKVTELSYRRLDGPGRTLQTLTSSARWQRGALSLSGLAIASTAGRVEGKSLRADFRAPGLQFDLALTLPHAVLDMDRFVLQGRLLPGGGSEQISGSITASGGQGTTERLKLAGQLGMTREALLFRKLALSKAGHPGQVAAEGRLDFAALEPALTLKLQTAGLDLASVTGVTTDLAGTLALTGTADRYLGQFALTNGGKDWRAAHLSGQFQGDLGGLQVTSFSGDPLGGSIDGNLALDWRSGLTLRGGLRAANLDPARVAPDWKGVVNAELDGSLILADSAPPRAEVNARILKSRLHGQALTGDLRLRLAEHNLRIASLHLLGRGFAIQASGQLAQRLDLTTDISDLSLLVPGAVGKLQAAGWVRWRTGQLAGRLDGQVRDLAAGGVQVASGDLTVCTDEGGNAPLDMSGTLRKVVAGAFRADALHLEAKGTLQQHSLKGSSRSAQADLRLDATGSYGRGEWRGTVQHFSGKDSQGSVNLLAPVQVRISPRAFSLGRLALVGSRGGRVELEAALSRTPLTGSARLEWTGLDLSRANPWLENLQATGSSQGSLRLGLQAGNRLSVSGHASASGSLKSRGLNLTVVSSELNLEGNERGTTAGISATLADGGTLKGSFTSSVPAALAMPAQGQLAIEWKGIDPGLIQPWLPGTVRMKGRFGGWTRGEIVAGNALSMEGEASLSQGDAQWEGADGSIHSAFKKAVVKWTWQGESLRGKVDLELAKRGQARGSFQIPLAARIPFAIDPQGSLQATFTGSLQEKGFLTTLLPGLVQESQGNLDARLQASGSWTAPQVDGELKLTKAGAYLPSAGIRLQDIQFTATLAQDRIRIENFKAVSGEGHLEGNAILQMQGWRVSHYQGTLTGDRFQTIFFPELQVLTSPNFSFDGTAEKLRLRGDIRIPELQVFGHPTRTAQGPSKDVVLVEAEPVVHRPSKVALDMQISVVLGDKVHIKQGGIDVQLGGSLELRCEDFDRISSKGEIRVVKGRFKAYGVNLDIVRGRLFYGGGPLDQPGLDFLALRTVNEVKAGVSVSGTLEEPVTRLYSDPVLPDLDVLGYIVLGHPVKSGDEASLAAMAAGALLSGKQGDSLQDQIEGRLGIQSMGIQQTEVRPSGAMGYKPMNKPSSSGSEVAQSGGTTEAMFTVGKYLTPRVYASYARSLSSSSYIFRLRYDLGKGWQAETQTGDESGVDLYYKIEFK